MFLDSEGAGLETRIWNGTPIARRAVDGYVNATAMAKANGKEWAHYFRTDRASTYIEALSRNCEIAVTGLYFAKPGDGTWIHPRLAVDFARWISPEFAVWMDGWFLESLAQGRQPRPEPPAPVAAPSPLPGSSADTAQALLLLAAHLERVPGIRPGILNAQLIACIEKSTGATAEPLRLALPAAEGPLCSCNATAIGEILGVSARKANQRLAEYGFQVRNARGDWELSEKGRAWGEALPYSNEHRSGYQVLWNPAVADELHGGGVELLDA